MSGKAWDAAGATVSIGSEMKSRTHTGVEEGLAKRSAAKLFVGHFSN
jgi:hypothetical protein